MKTCNKCLETKDSFEFYDRETSSGSPYKSSVCKECQKIKAKRHRETDHGKKTRKIWDLKKYGLTLEQYDSMLKSQNYACKICKEGSTKHPKYKDGSFSVDHCHQTGKVRGLLCTRCNLVLGKVADSIWILKSAIDYLK